ncbi:DUF1493 family protein [Pseudomonas graminis]
MIDAEEVRSLIRKHLWEMPDDHCLNNSDESILPEDAQAFFEEYFSQFDIDAKNFSFRNYFPNAGIRFLPNCILPDYLKTDRHSPRDLTVNMIIESAKAGRWLYD